MNWTQIGQILTPEQIEQAVAILNKNLPDLQETKELKAFCQSIAPDLDAKGMDPDYTAYMLQFAGMQARENQPPSGNPMNN